MGDPWEDMQQSLHAVPALTMYDTCGHDFTIPPIYLAAAQGPHLPGKLHAHLEFFLSTCATLIVSASIFP
jgi:hypothetical protein